jgi:hypothetical protein
MQINKGCSIEFLSAQTILAISIHKENAKFVTDFNATKVRYLDASTQLMHFDSDGK